MSGSPDPRSLTIFAELLEYPGPHTAAAAREGAARLAEGKPEAAALVRKFETFVQSTPLGELEETYTGTFELNAACHPYVGYHLFGETYKRSLFLLGLKESFATHGFQPEKELPDHLAVLLRFLAACDDAAEADELVNQALLPALDRMIAATRKDKDAAHADRESAPSSDRLDPYRNLLKALVLSLQGDEAVSSSGSPAAASREAGGE